MHNWFAYLPHYMSVRSILPRIRGSLMNKYLLQWRNDLVYQPKLRTYRTFKEQYCAEPYIIKYLSPHLRSCLAQFRAGILPIEIELGRFRNKRPGERLCILCNNGEIEDEIHFLLRCEHYMQFRNFLFTNTNVNPSGDPGRIIKTLMDNHPTKLALFLCNALQKRKSTLYIIGP